MLRSFRPPFSKGGAVKARSLVALRRERNIPNEPFFLLLFLWALLLPKEKVIAPGERLEANGDGRQRPAATGDAPVGELAARTFENVEHFERR
ncbi:MAG: hypothetical protein IKB51_03640 [Clostridia bacterium]|nr:hypothetical protein [Clostridia bacterium]